MDKKQVIVSTLLTILFLGIVGIGWFWVGKNHQERILEVEFSVNMQEVDTLLTKMYTDESYSNTYDDDFWFNSVAILTLYSDIMMYEESHIGALDEIQNTKVNELMEGLGLSLLRREITHLYDSEGRIKSEIDETTFNFIEERLKGVSEKKAPFVKRESARLIAAREEFNAVKADEFKLQQNEQKVCCCE